MGLDAKANFVGIVTATGEVPADKGALRVADNVTLRREGALTLRQTFGSTSLSRSYLAAFPYKGQLLFLGTNNTLYNPSQAAISPSVNEWQLGTPVGAVRADVQSAKEARGNFYLAASQGVYKLNTPTGAYFGAGIAAPAGVQYVNQELTGTLLLAANQRVAYRLVLKVTDLNGLIVRSRPTGATVVESAATPFSPIVAMSVPYYLPTDGRKVEVEVYRTRVFPNTATVDDELQLVATLVPTNGNSPNLFFTDRVADAARGMTLYTSPSRGGIENASDRPPGCACIERFRTSLFFGNTRGPMRTTVSFRWNGDVTGSATGIGARAVSASWTSGSANVTVNSAVGIEVGQLLNVGSAPPYHSTLGSPYVTAVSGTNLTMNFAANSTRSNVASYLYDTFWINTSGTWNGPYVMPQPPGTPVIGSLTGGASLSAYLNFAANAYEVTPPNPGYHYTVVIEQYPRGNLPMAVRATHGGEFSPPIALASSSAGTPGAYDDLPHSLMWSEPDEPEHVPIKNSARVGDAGKAILALVATRDRLLIFKEDGLFMLTGDTSKNFGIYPLDTTCLCILPGSVRRLQNTVYCLTNLGLVAVDENGGVTVVSRAIQTEIAPIVTQIRQAQKASGLYNMPGLSGITGTSDDANGEYWLALGSTTPSFGGQVLVWNAFSGGFTTYSVGTPAPVALAQDGEGQPLVLTASTLLTPGTTLGAITARISPHAFSDPQLVGKFWTHIVAGISQLTGTASVTAKFTSSESMNAAAQVTEQMEAPVDAGTSLVQLPLGSLLRHPVPSVVRRAFLLFVELTIAVTNGMLVLEFIGVEDRGNIPNKRPSHGTGTT